MRPFAPTAPPSAPRRAPDPLEACLDRYLLTGDAAAIERVVSETRPRLLAAARRIGAPQDAEDAVQTAYLSLVRHRGASLDAPLFPWLLTAVVRNAYRRKAIQRRETSLAERLARPRSPAESGATAPDAAAVAEEVARLRATVVRLPARYRDPAVLHLLEGLSIAEVARLLDLPEGTVRTRLFRARRLVRARLFGVAVDARVLSVLLAVPWFLSDVGGVAAEGGGAGSVALTMGTGAKLGVVGLAVALALAVGFGVALAGSPSADEEQHVAERAARVRALEAEIAALHEDVARLAARRSEPSLAIAAPRPAPAATATPAPVPAAPAPGPLVGAAPAAERAAGTPPIAFERAGIEAWDVDWADIGRRLLEMAPLISEFAEKWGTSKDEKMADMVGRLSSLNGPLVTYAMKAFEHLKPESGINGAFVHPWFMANAIAATLEAAGKPLDAAQVGAIRRAADDTIAEAKRLAGQRGQPEFLLEHLLQESAARAAFFDAARAALTPEQREVLGPKGTAGRLQGDLFSAGLLWTGYVSDALEFTTRDDLVRRVLENLGAPGFPEARRVAAERAVLEWVGAWPSVVADAPGDSMSLQGFLPLAWVEEATRRQVALSRRLIEAGAVDAAGADALRRSTKVSPPVYVGPAR